MKFDLSKEVVNYKGEAIKNADGKVVILKESILSALLSIDTRKEVPGEEKYNLYKLAAKCDVDELVELKAEEVSKIKDLVGKVYSPVAVGAIWEMMEKPVTEEAPKAE